MIEGRGAFRRIGLCVLTVLILLWLAGCHGADRQAATDVLSDFYAALKIVDDPLFKNAALNEDAEPGKAKEYFDAHERLREIMVDQERKAVILAAFLARQPTALRPLTFKNAAGVMEAKVALGPTDEKTGTFAFRKVGEKWRIEDFDGAYAKRKSLVNPEGKAELPASAGEGKAGAAAGDADPGSK